MVRVAVQTHFVTSTRPVGAIRLLTLALTLSMASCGRALGLSGGNSAMERVKVEERWE